MKWFKHDSDAGNDAKLRKLRIKYGAQGYGIYWYCLELIARNVEKHNLTFELEHDAELIADDFKLSGEFVQEMMLYMVNLGLFENTHGVITCLKMSTRTDEYTAKLLQKIKNSPDNVPTISEESPTKSELIEEKRREEKRDTTPKGSRLTNDFKLPIEWIDEALEIKPMLTPKDISEIFATFKDYWIAKAGKDGVKLDWLATWRNWVRRQEIKPTQKRPTGVVL